MYMHVHMYVYFHRIVIIRYDIGLFVIEIVIGKYFV